MPLKSTPVYGQIESEWPATWIGTSKAGGTAAAAKSGESERGDVGASGSLSQLGCQKQQAHVRATARVVRSIEDMIISLQSVVRTVAVHLPPKLSANRRTEFLLATRV